MGERISWGHLTHYLAFVMLSLIAYLHRSGPIVDVLLVNFARIGTFTVILPNSTPTNLHVLSRDALPDPGSACCCRRFCVVSPQNVVWVNGISPVVFCLIARWQRQPVQSEVLTYLPQTGMEAYTEVLIRAHTRPGLLVFWVAKLLLPLRSTFGSFSRIHAVICGGRASSRARYQSRPRVNDMFRGRLHPPGGSQSRTAGDRDVPRSRVRF